MKRMGAALLLLGMGLGTAFAESGLPSLAAVRQRLEEGGPVTIVCLGDSITGTYYHTGSRRSYPALLEGLLRDAFPGAAVTVLQAGRSGETAGQGLARLERDALAFRPDLVTILFGMNDCARSTLEDFDRHLQELVDRSRARGAALVLLTPNAVYETAERPVAVLEQYVGRIRALAGAEDLPLVDLYGLFSEIRQDDRDRFARLFSDAAIHPNLHGHLLMAERLAAVVAGREIDARLPVPLRPWLPVSGPLLREGGPLRIIVASQEASSWRAALREVFPAAVPEFVEWPCEDGPDGLRQARLWANRIRGLHPHLVVAGFPPAALSAPRLDVVELFSWLLNAALPVGSHVAPWDVVVVESSGMEQAAPRRRALLRELAAGKDLPLIEARTAADPRALADWLRQAAGSETP